MQKAKSFLRLIRLGNLTIIAITMYAIRFGVIYPLFKINHFHLQMTGLEFFLLMFSTVLIAAAGYIINDYSDTHSDLINKPGKLVIGKTLSRKFAINIFWVINFLGLVISILLSLKLGEFKLCFISVIAASLLWFYSTNFKHQLLVGNLVVAFVVALVPFLSGIYELMLFLHHSGKLIAPLIKNLSPQAQRIALNSFKFSVFNMLYWVLAYSIFAFFITFIREVVKDIEDIKGDAASGTYSMPVAYGIRKTKNFVAIISVLLLIFIILFQFKQLSIQNSWFFYYSLILIDIPLLCFLFYFLSSNEKINFSRCSKLLKLIMLLGILYLPLFCYSVLNF